MGKLKSIITGVMLGAGAMYVGLQYHVLLAPEGFLLVPRAPQHSLQDAYADVQTWDEESWASRPQLSLAVSEHGRADLFEGGAQQGGPDDYHNSFTPQQEQLGKTSNRWEPVYPSDIPAPIANGKIAKQISSPQEGKAPKRGFLSLVELFGFKSSKQDQGQSSTGKVRTESFTPVLPTRSTRPPRVEFLPSPDEVDLGQPRPLPRRSGSRWRQSDADVEGLKRSASRQPEWEPLAALSTELEAL